MSERVDGIWAKATAALEAGEEGEATRLIQEALPRLSAAEKDELSVLLEQSEAHNEELAEAYAETADAVTALAQLLEKYEAPRVGDLLNRELSPEDAVVLARALKSL